MQKELPLPPYGKIMQAYIDANVFPLESECWPVWNIYIGRDSDKFARKQIVESKEVSCYLPYQQSYEQYRWPITGHNIGIINVGFISINFLKMMAIDLFAKYKPKTLIAFESIHNINDKEYIPTNSVVCLYSK